MGIQTARFGRLFVGTALMVLILGTIGVFSGCSSVEGQSGFGPLIAGVTPARGPVGTKIEISGTGFGPMVGDVTLTDKNKTEVGAPVYSWTDTLVVVEVPALPSGVQTAAVNVHSSAFAPSAQPGSFTITAPPPAAATVQ